MVLSCDTSRNIMKRAHANPILDPRMYQVEFVGGKVTELLPMSLPSQCMPYVMQTRMCIFLDALADYHKHNKEVSLTDQQIAVQGKLKVGKVAACGRMVLPHGRSCPS